MKRKPTDEYPDQQLPSTSKTQRSDNSLATMFDQLRMTGFLDVPSREAMKVTQRAYAAVVQKHTGPASPNMRWNPEEPIKVFQTLPGSTHDLRNHVLDTLLSVSTEGGRRLTLERFRSYYGSVLWYDVRYRATVQYTPVPADAYGTAAVSVANGMALSLQYKELRMDVPVVLYATASITDEVHVGHIVVTVEEMLDGTPLEAGSLGAKEDLPRILSLVAKFVRHWDQGYRHGDIRPWNILQGMDGVLRVANDVITINKHRVDRDDSYPGQPPDCIENEIYSLSRTLLECMGHKTPLTSLKQFLHRVVHSSYTEFEAQWKSPSGFLHALQNHRDDIYDDIHGARHYPYMDLDILRWMHGDVITIDHAELVIRLDVEHQGYLPEDRAHDLVFLLAQVQSLLPPKTPYVQVNISTLVVRHMGIDRPMYIWRRADGRTNTGSFDFICTMNHVRFDVNHFTCVVINHQHLANLYRMDSD